MRTYKIIYLDNGKYKTAIIKAENIQQAFDVFNEKYINKRTVSIEQI
jgi:hypothetical protein